MAVDVHGFFIQDNVHNKKKTKTLPVKLKTFCLLTTKSVYSSTNIVTILNEIRPFMHRHTSKSKMEQTGKFLVFTEWTDLRVSLQLRDCQ